MAHYEFLRKLGVFAVPRFLSEEECARWRELADTSGGVPARVYEDDRYNLNEEYRRTLSVTVQDPLEAGTVRRLQELLPALGAYFGVEIGEMEKVSCLVYRPGDFFRLHRDVANEPELRKDFRILKRRAVTVVVFLNEPGCAAAAYEGGVLSLYGLLGTPAASEFGFAVDAECGLLVAFRAGTLHEVSPVTGGMRYTLVTWYLDREPEDRDEHQLDVQTETPRSD